MFGIDMTPYEIYIFILCLIVFIMLAGFSAICIVTIYKLCVRLIRSGLEDDRIIEEEYYRYIGNGAFRVIDRILTFFMLTVFLVVFAVSIFVGITENTYFENIPSFRVVRTASMAKVHPKNEYLNALGINNRIQTFDLILTYEIPPEDELQLYDIVVYEVDEMLIVHRIVGIEPPNESHPDETYFLLQGDAVEAADRFPVRYSQMKASYRDEKIPFVGSLILFMQSPAGWLCILLAFGTSIIVPIVEKSIEDEKYKRLIHK